MVLLLSFYQADSLLTSLPQTFLSSLPIFFFIQKKSINIQSGSADQPDADSGRSARKPSRVAGGDKPMEEDTGPVGRKESLGDGDGGNRRPSVVIDSAPDDEPPGKLKPAGRKPSVVSPRD